SSGLINRLLLRSVTSPFPTTERINFRGWPDAQIRCTECWFWGQKFGRIDSDITISGDTLTLTNGLIDTGFSRLTADGEWVNNPGNYAPSSNHCAFSLRGWR
ncbi:hypothetical protein ACUOFC_52940, partial [Escherichia sp. TWPC-MK]